jgi:hypothetical protein
VCDPKIPLPLLILTHYAHPPSQQRPSKPKRKSSSPGFGSPFYFKHIFSTRPSSSSNPSKPQDGQPNSSQARSYSLDGSLRPRRSSSRSSRSNSNDKSDDQNAGGVELSLFNMTYRNESGSYDYTDAERSPFGRNEDDDNNRSSIYDSAGGIRAEPMYYEEVRRKPRPGSRGRSGERLRQFDRHAFLCRSSSSLSSPPSSRAPISPEK